MKNGIVKIWVCQECQKEFLDRPIVCTKCKKLNFEVKYAGQVHDAEELTKLIYAYREDAYREELKKIDVSKKTPAKDNAETTDTKPDKNKRTRL